MFLQQNFSDKVCGLQNFLEKVCEPALLALEVAASGAIGARLSRWYNYMSDSDSKGPSVPAASLSAGARRPFCP